MNLFSDTIASVKRTNIEDLFLIRIVAKPCATNPEAAEFGGAYVNCWVDADELRLAETQAISAIENENWTPTKFDDWEFVCRRFYIENAAYNETERRELLERVDEAFQRGISITLNCWSKDAPDGDEEI